MRLSSLPGVDLVRSTGLMEGERGDPNSPFNRTPLVRRVPGLDGVVGDTVALGGAERRR